MHIIDLDSPQSKAGLTLFTVVHILLLSLYSDVPPLWPHTDQHSLTSNFLSLMSTSVLVLWWLKCNENFRMKLKRFFWLPRTLCSFYPVPKYAHMIFALSYKSWMHIIIHNLGHVIHQHRVRVMKVQMGCKVVNSYLGKNYKYQR